MQKYSDIVLDSRGNALAGISVTVKTYPADTLATLYSDNGVTTTGNPLTTDTKGRYSFYAEDGHYSLTFSGTGYDTQTLADEIILDGTRTPPISAADFLCVGDGVTDDTAALTDFFNSAIANPGVEHFLPEGIYLTSAALPTINVNNVKIVGAGGWIHDVGDVVTGSVIKATAAMSRVVLIQSQSGASNQRISNITFKGIGINCNANAGYGIEIYSVADSDIDVAVANPTEYSIGMNVVASLGEARDNQRNKIRLFSRNVEYALGGAIVVGGDASANTSMNDFWIEAQHANSPAVRMANSDNNDWRYIRTYKVPAGTATESVQFLGGSSTAERCRGERIHFLTSNLTCTAYGTGTYTYGAENISIYNLDTDNGTPEPTVQIGASLSWNRQSTPFGDASWVAHTPTITAGSGTFTSVAGTTRYRIIGRTIHLRMQIAITTNGTAATYIQATLPFACASQGAVFTGLERAVTGYGAVGYVDASSSNLIIRRYDAVYLGGNGYVINLSGTYELA